MNSYIENEEVVFYTINTYTNKVSTKYSVMTGLPQVTHKIATSIIHLNRVKTDRIF